ncbi:AAA family ATPase [Deinococcus sonorensis]|uniref:AAA family ATPase n=2 Tax=Deinococcus sonorensis TaxID=309891 RepID=A0AAU7UCV0_9DEIO
MLTVHLLGHAHVTQNGQPVPLSAKAVALIAYLATEKLPQHRERLADLLWNTSEARTNLRVELARIRSAGLNVFPSSRQLLYLESVGTDIDHWRAQADTEMNQTQLSSWLATLRGLPLCGLEDLGSTAFQVWVEQQRWMLCEQVEQSLARVYWRYAQAGQDWATRLISARAEAVGFADPAELDAPEVEASELAVSAASAEQRAAPAPSAPARISLPEPAPAPRAAEALPAARVRQPEPSGAPRPVVFERPHEEALLTSMLERAQKQPQLVLLHGPPGMGKSHLVRRVAAQHPQWQELRLGGGKSGRLVLAALAQALIRCSDAEGAEILQRVLLSPGTLEEDAVKLAVAYARCAQPLLLVCEEVQNAPQELADLLLFMIQMPSEGPRAFLLLCREQPDRLPLTRGLWQRLPAEQRSVIELPMLTRASIQRALEQRFPQEPARRLQASASRLLQRSGGNPLHLVTLLDGVTELERIGGTTLPQAVRESYGSEADSWRAGLQGAMGRLSVINGSFDRVVAQRVLNELTPAQVDALLCEALDRQLLCEVEPGTALRVPDLTVQRAGAEGEPQYMFRNEGLRITLAGQLPQLIRQDVRRQLMDTFAESAPGLASYYAERAGLTERARELLQVHQSALGAAHPLVQPGRTPVAPVAYAAPIEPPRNVQQVRPPVSHLGYSVLMDGGWLTVVSDGRFGPPQTLDLLFELPEGLGTTDVSLVWRMDTYGSGEEVRPSLVPFPLRLQVAGSRTAHVFSPQLQTGFEAEGLSHVAHPRVGVASWMEHHFQLDVAGARQLICSVRAIDLSMSLGRLVVGGRELLPVGTAVHHPAEGYAAGAAALL